MEATMHGTALAAHAWLRGYSDRRFDKPDGSRKLYPGTGTADGNLRDSYLAGRRYAEAHGHDLLPLPEAA